MQPVKLIMDVFIKKSWRILIKIIITVIVLFAILIIISSVNIFGFQMFVVRSGSMEPKIKTGSVVFDKKQKSYKVDDVVTYRLNGSRDTVTHRIFETKLDINKNTFYSVKGDANNAPDEGLVPIENVVGKVQFTLLYIGYLVAFIKSLPGLIIFIIIPVTIIIYEEIGKIKKEIIKIRKGGKKIKREAKKEEIMIVRYIRNHYKIFTKRLTQNIVKAKQEKEKNEN